MYIEICISFYIHIVLSVVIHLSVVDFVYKFMSGGGNEGFAYVYCNK